MSVSVSVSVSLLSLSKFFKNLKSILFGLFFNTHNPFCVITKEPFSGESMSSAF